MQDLDDEVLYEAVELSKAVFSRGEGVFREGYDGGVEAYMLIQDLRNRVEIATMDSGEMVYPEELESFGDFDDPGEAVKFFYSVGEEGYDPESDMAEIFEEAGLVEFSDGEIFYGENAFPYLMLLEEGERIVEGSVEEDYVDPFEGSDGGDEEILEGSVESSGNGDSDGIEGDLEEDGEESDEDKFSRLQGIMEDSVDSDDDLVFEESSE